MKKMQVILSLLISICLLNSNCVFASDITASGSLGSSDVILTHEATMFSATVPTGLLIDVMSDGTVITATECNILNNSYAPIVVADVSVETKDDWKLVKFDSNFSSFAVNKKNLGFQLNSENVSTRGKVALARTNWPIINGYSEIPLDYDANLPAVSQATEYHSIATVVFTISFWETTGNQITTALFNVEDIEEVVADVSTVTLNDANAGLWTWTEAENEELTIVRYNGIYGDTVDLTVPSQINGKPVIALNASTFEGKRAYKSLSIPEGVVLRDDSLVGVTAETITIADNCYLEKGSLGKIDVTNLVIGKNVDITGVETTTRVGALRSTSFTLTDNISGGSTIDNLYIDSNVPGHCFVGCGVSNITFGTNCSSIGPWAFSIGGIKGMSGLESVTSIGVGAFAPANYDSGGSYRLTRTSAFDSSMQVDLVIGDGCVLQKDSFCGATINSLTLKEGSALAGYDSMHAMTINNLTIADTSSIPGGYPGYLPSTTVNTLNINDDIPAYFACTYRSDYESDTHIYNLNIGPNCNRIGEDAFRTYHSYEIQKVTGLSNVTYFGSNAFAAGIEYSYSAVSGGLPVIAKGALADQTINFIDTNTSTSIFENSTVAHDRLQIGAIYYGQGVTETKLSRCDVGTVTYAGGQTSTKGILSSTIDKWVISDTCELTTAAVSTNTDTTVNKLIINCDIPAGAFSNFPTIKSVEFGPNCTTVGSSAFYITKIEKISGIENLTSIQDKAFYNAIIVQNDIVLNDNAVVGTNAFYNCTLGTVSVGENTDYSSGNISGTVVVRN